MRAAALLIATLVAGGLPTTARGETARLTIRADLACQLSVDGEARGRLRPGDALRIDLAPGAHRVEATPEDGGTTWRSTVELRESRELAIPLKGYWVDPATNLVWAASDNGVGASWTQALRYCRSLTAGGFRDWRLPSIDELHGLFGGRRTMAGVERHAGAGTRRTMGSRLRGRRTRFGRDGRLGIQPSALRARGSQVQ